MHRFFTKEDSIQSLNLLLDDNRSHLGSFGAAPIDQTILYKVFVLAQLHYPTAEEFREILEKNISAPQLFENLTLDALHNIKQDKIDFSYSGASLIDLTESLYEASSSGRTKTTRLLYGSFPSVLLGFIWNHNSGVISKILDSDPRSNAMLNFDRSRFALTATGIRFQISSNWSGKLILALTKFKKPMFWFGKRYAPNFYAYLVRGILKFTKSNIKDSEGRFIPIFGNKIFMNDYANWNRKTLSRIKTLIQNTESDLYLTLHDDIVYRIPDFFSDERIAEFMNVLDLARVATHVFVPSLAESQNIARHFPSAANISVVHWSGDHILKLGSEAFKRSSGGSKTFLHFLGNDPRKNSFRIFSAMFNVVKKGSHFDLIIVGNPPSLGTSLFSIFEEFKRFGVKIDFVTNISEEGLVSIYQRSDCLIYCSLAEGFGIPIVEASAVGCAVITSNFGSMLEVGNMCSGVIFVDPFDISDIEQALLIFVDSETSHKSMNSASPRPWRDVYGDILNVMGVPFE